MTRLRIGTRGSALALWQSRHIAARLTALVPEVAIELVEIVSTGDRVTDVPLSHVEGTGFFTATIEHALLDRQVDVAVHSCKDLPVAPTPDLVLAAIPTRGPSEDALVARDGLTLATLPPGARVGTCSLRRTAQVRARRPDLVCVPLRGNVPTRVSRVVNGELDAIVLALAGLERLGLADHISQVFDTAEVLPAPAQGALAVQCHAADVHVHALLAKLDDADTRRAVTAERHLLHVLGGGCSVPVGARAVVHQDRITLAAAVFDVTNGQALRAVSVGPTPETVGDAVARSLLDLGAGAWLDAAEAAETLDTSRHAGVPA